MNGKLSVNDIIRRKRDGFEFLILEINQTDSCKLYTCRDINNRLTWVFAEEGVQKDFEKMFETAWGESRGN